MTQNKHKQKQEDTYGQAAGAIGALAIAFGALAAIKDQLGLSWPATVLLTVGALIALGYLAWRLKTGVKQLWAREASSATAAPHKAAVVAQMSAEGLPDAEAEGPSAHPQLTTVLSTAGVIGKGEIIRADEVTITPLDAVGGNLYDFLLPQGHTYEEVEKKLGAVAGGFGKTRLHTKLERSRLSERQVQLLVLDEPPFTRPFAPPTRQEIAAFNGVPLGHDVTGKLTGVETFDKASMLIGGMSQMGKTTLVNGLITCLLIAYGDFDLYLLDGKFCGLTKFEKIAVRYEASDEPEVFEEYVDHLLAEVERRYRVNTDAIRNRQPTPKFKPVFFIVDEVADFFADDGSSESKEQARRIEEKTRKLVSKSLESGVSSIMLTQRPAQNAIPVKVRDQFLYRMCLYVASGGSAKVALGDSYFETVAPIHPALLDSKIKGQGVLFVHGESTLIRGFNFPDEFIWEIVDERITQKEQVLQEVPDSPLKQAVSLMQEKGCDFIPTVELAPHLGITENRPGECGKQVSKLLGVASDKDSQGVRGYKLASLKTALMSGL